MADLNSVCPICGGMGIVSHDVPIDHPDFGKAFACVCQADKAKARRAASLRGIGNLDAYASKTFAAFEIDPGRPNVSEEALQTLAAISDHRKRSLTDEQLGQINVAAERALHYAYEPAGWLLFKGSYGTGKTHLAAAIANWRLEHSEPVLFVSVPNLLDHLRSTYGPSSEIAYDDYFEQVQNAPLLILDDLGAENQTPWALEKLYQLLSHRHTARLPTVITTNVEPDSFDPRIRSRLLDVSLTESIPLNVPDRRSPMTTYQEVDLTNLDRYAAMTFNSFDLRHEEGLPDADSKNLDRTIRKASAYAEYPADWLVLMGVPGCGKTHLAAAIANRLKDSNQRILFVTASELLDHLRATFYPGSTVAYDKQMEAIKAADVLILDDLAIDKNLSSWARGKLYEILFHRYDYRKPTVITTNQMLSEIDPRLKSRITNRDHCVIEALDVPSYPGKTAVRRAASPRHTR